LFDDDTAINEVVTDGETFHTNVEVSASACEIEQCGVALRTVDAKPPLPRHIRVADTAFGISINSGTCIIWRGQPKVRSLVKGSARVAVEVLVRRARPCGWVGVRGPSSS
jgi:hypothetical protein